MKYRETKIDLHCVLTLKVRKYLKYEGVIRFQRNFTVKIA